MSLSQLNREQQMALKHQWPSDKCSHLVSLFEGKRTENWNKLVKRTERKREIETDSEVNETCSKNNKAKTKTVSKR